MKKKNKSYLSAIAHLAMLSLITVLALIIRTYYLMDVLQKQIDVDQTVSDYSYHCAFIASSSADDFRNSIYEAARAEGRTKGILVENIGQNLPITYSLDQRLKMAIAANVDAILVEPSGQFSTRHLLDIAAEKGIAVGTIYRDELKTTRYNYTGVNNASLGAAYGDLALAYSSETDLSMIVLLDETERTSEHNLFTSEMNKTLSQVRPQTTLDVCTLDETNAFDAEENIRQLLKDNHDSIDVIICTTLLQTQYVSQLVIDLNYVGNFTIIGSYQNPTILEALKNGVLSASIVIDTKQMGQKAIENLSEYLQTGHSSVYTQVATYTLTSDDAAALLASSSSAAKGEKGYEE